MITTETVYLELMFLKVSEIAGAMQELRFCINTNGTID
jgi:hypothetical protein